MYWRIKMLHTRPMELDGTWIKLLNNDKQILITSLLLASSENISKIISTTLTSPVFVYDKLMVKCSALEICKPTRNLLYPPALQYLPYSTAKECYLTCIMTLMNSHACLSITLPKYKKALVGKFKKNIHKTVHQKEELVFILRLVPGRIFMSPERKIM